MPDEANRHHSGKEENTTRMLIESMLEGWGPQRVAGKEGHDPLGLQCRNLHHGREEAKPSLKARAMTNCHRWGKCGMVVPDRVPAKASDFE